MNPVVDFGDVLFSSACALESMMVVAVSFTALFDDRVDIEL